MSLHHHVHHCFLKALVIYCCNHLSIFSQTMRSIFSCCHLHLIVMSLQFQPPGTKVKARTTQMIQAVPSAQPLSAVKPVITQDHPWTSLHLPS
jgi:hypothetical protein